MKEIIIVCEDIFGAEVYAILDEINRWQARRGEEEPYRILGYISDREAPFAQVRIPIQRLGSVVGWHPLGREGYVLGMKLPASKYAAVELLAPRGCEFETVTTPWMIAPQIKIGEGSLVAARSMKASMKIGRFVTVVESMLPAHYVGDYSTVLRFSNVTGDVGEGAYVGNHVYSHTGTKIGDNAFVSDGSIVIKDVKPGTKVAGVPARKIKG